jgi:heme/copper-type cytochrome/quinol oxidase subunit 2
MNEVEAIIAIGVCLMVFLISIIGILIYWIVEIRREQRANNLKTQVLIESVIEIFLTKYKIYEDDEKGGIGPGA